MVSLMRSYLEAVCAALLVPLRSGKPWRERSLWQQQDLWALAQNVEACLVVHITLVWVPLFAEQERPSQDRKQKVKLKYLYKKRSNKIEC